MQLSKAEARADWLPGGGRAPPSPVKEFYGNADSPAPCVIEVEKKQLCVISLHAFSSRATISLAEPIWLKSQEFSVLESLIKLYLGLDM